MNKKTMLRNLIMMGTLLLLLVAAAVAWFISMTQGSMDNTSFDSAEAIESQVVTSGGYSGELLDMQVFMIPCSGTAETDANGKADLYTVTTDPFTEAEPLEATWQRAYGQNEAQIDYANQVAYLSYLDYYSVVTATHQARLVLGGESRVYPVVADPDGTDPEHPDRKIKSDYGEFSVDNIAGAVRVAFILCTPDDPSAVTADLGFDNMGNLCNIRSYDEVSGEPEDYDIIDDYTEQLVMIWVPNDTYEITEQFTDVSGGGVMVLSGADFVANGAPEAEYSYYDHSSGEVKTYAEGEFCTDSMLGQAGFIQLADSLWHNAAKGNYCACLKIRIWVEGYDREASIALAEGMFDSEIFLLTIQEAS